MKTCPHALLTHPDLGVRPPGEPVPAALASEGGPLAEVFVRWLRQRDDAAHAGEKGLLIQVLRALPDEAVRCEAQRQAAVAMGGGGWDHWVWAVPAATVAALLGMRMDTVEQQVSLVSQLRAVAGALAADASASDLHEGNGATLTLLRALRAAEAGALDAPLQSAWLHHTAGHHWPDPLTGEAHRLALLWQSHEAGTALLGHGLWDLVCSGAAPDRERLRDIAADGGAVRRTRRFVQRPTMVDGCELASGSPVTVALTDRSVIFGAGAHRCPGESLALTTVETALAWAGKQTLRPLPVQPRTVELPNMALVMFGSGVGVTTRGGDVA